MFMCGCLVGLEVVLPLSVLAETGSSTEPTSELASPIEVTEESVESTSSTASTTLPESEDDDSESEESAATTTALGGVASSTPSASTTATTTSTSTETLVATGDATSYTQTETTANTTDLSASTSNATTTVTTEQNAVVAHTGSTSATTGDNHASSTGTSTIYTGDAVAAHEFINVINTTVYNSQGFLFLMNMLFGSGVFDLRELDFASFVREQAGTIGGSAPTVCTLDGCSDDRVAYQLVSTSTATVTTSHVVRASTGGNQATGSTAAVATGNAYGFLNGLNVVNSNFIDSNYLLVSINNIGDYLGDLVLPGAAFFEQFLTSAPGSARSHTTDVSNEAVVENNLVATADTGDNHASTTGSSDVATGNACALSNVHNTVNQTHVNAQMVNILVRVSGDWSGNIFGLPDGLSWEETNEGIRIYSEAPEVVSAASSTGAITDTKIHNSAYINNDISVTALTGDNQVSGGRGTIATGDACVVANVQNVANTNVIGSNWLSAFFNIVGNFGGNISFGRPDLWLGGIADLSGEYVAPGSELSYTYTIFNNGDATANNVILKQTPGSRLTNIRTSDLTPVASSTDEWHIGTLAPNASTEVQFTAAVSDDLPYGVSPLEVSATLEATEPDNNDTDNTETISLLGYRSTPQGGGSGGSEAGSRASAPDLSVIKWANATTSYTVTAGASTTDVQYTIQVRNQGGEAYDAVLHDVLRDEAGNTLSEQQWELGTIAAEEVIEVSYSVSYGLEWQDGLYTNEAWLEAYRRDRLGERDPEESLSIGRGGAYVVLDRNSEQLAITDISVNATGEFADAGTALVRFSTNYPVATRVVFAPGEYTPATAADMNGENFGYLFSADSAVATTSHEIALRGLLPGRGYGFRAVAERGEMVVLSAEGFFTTPEQAPVEPEPIAGPAMPPVTPLVAFSETDEVVTSEARVGKVAGTSTEQAAPRSLLLPLAYANTGLSETAALCQQNATGLLVALMLLLAFMLWVLKEYRTRSQQVHPRAAWFLARNLSFVGGYCVVAAPLIVVIADCAAWRWLIVSLCLWLMLEGVWYFGGGNVSAKNGRI